MLSRRGRRTAPARRRRALASCPCRAAATRSLQSGQGALSALQSLPPSHPRGTMRARLVMPVLAAVCVSLLGCDRVPTAARNPGGPSFITNGALDGNAHPAVVLIIMDIAGKPAFRCSGTIIAPKLVLTAGHCAGEPGEFSGLRIFNEADVQDDPTYPNPGGPNTIEATAWHAHPLFTERAFFLHDVGVVLLSKAVKLPSSQYGKLPTQDQLDALQPSSHTTFTAVGYGLQQINPVFVVAEKIRMFAEPHLIQINGGIVGDFSLLLSRSEERRVGKEWRCRWGADD